MAVKIASAGVSQGRISPKRPLLRWPITVPKVIYQHQYWLKGRGRRGECLCVLVELRRSCGRGQDAVSQPRTGGGGYLDEKRLSCWEAANLAIGNWEV